MLSLAHKNLKVYGIILQFVNEVYQLTQNFPRDEQYGLTRQMRRAAISVCSNLAEGSSRKSTQEKRRFYEVSRSSLVEVDTQLVIAINLKFLEKDRANKLDEHIVSIFRVLSKMINNLE